MSLSNKMRRPPVEKHDSRRPPYWCTEDEDMEAVSCRGHDGAPGEGGHRQPRWNMSNWLRRDQGNNLDNKSISAHEEELIIKLHATIGSRWTIIAQQLPGRTESEVKNCWNTKLKKRLAEMGIDPVTHKPFSQRRRQQQPFSPKHFYAHPSKSPGLMPSSPSTSLLSSTKSIAKTLSWADFLVGEDSFKATGGQPCSLAGDDLHGIRMPNIVECPLSSSPSSSSAADDSFVETLLNKHTETFMDFPEIWEDDESIR
ncbi:hypothetical protein MLD38_021838 [Melastoma candidum]|uniref:Uncharacterized protein n=1 Tax=Melastoma candidum TaxID=119954 RepID=A0ACB9QGK2_9MYRT|nr:hypothetical protein MLD38_021838 [Melastoma candidum]